MDNISVLNINNKFFCAFCGNEINPNENGAFHCQCNDAKLYRKALATKLQLEMSALNIMANAPKPKYGPLTICAPLQNFTPSDNTDDEPNPCF